MAQIIPFPFDKVQNNKNKSYFTEKHILYMIKNIRQNYPPSLWNTIYHLAKQGHLNKFLIEDQDDKQILPLKEIE